MVKAIQETFQQEESSSSILEKSDNPDKAQNLPSDGAENSAQSIMPDSNSYTIVHVTENFQVRIHLGKVTDVPAHAIVCPQDEYLSSKDDIALEIFKKLPNWESKSSNKKKNYGDISSQSLHGNSPWKFIIHAVTPRYDCDYSKDSMKFEAVLKTLIQNIIKAADEANIGSVAIPLLGAGNVSVHLFYLQTAKWRLFSYEVYTGITIVLKLCFFFFKIVVSTRLEPCDQYQPNLGQNILWWKAFIQIGTITPHFL